MNRRFRTPFALLLLLALVLPIIVACGSPQAGGTTTEATAAATTAPETAATEAPAETEAATEEPAAAEAATEEATATEAATEEATATEAATEEATATEAAAEATVAGGAVEVNPAYLVFGGSGEPDTLDSMNTTAGTALVVAQQITERLLAFEPGGSDITEGLATSWTPNEDSTEWTFELREGVQFHDGTPFNAEAVVFNFNRLADPTFEFGFREGETGNTFPIFPDIFGGFKGEENSIWEGIEAVDENTVRISLTKSVPLLPNYLAASYFGISSPEAVREAGARYGTPEVGAVGTGPFTFEEWRPGESVSLKRNDDYWGDEAKMPGIAFRFIADQPQRQAELEAGTIDFTINLSPDARETIANNPDLQVVPLEPFNMAYLALDMTAKPLDDVRVRQAIAYAINKQEILDGLYGGVGEVADTFLPDALAWARPESVEPYAYDPDRARALLAEAGLADGFSEITLADGTVAPLELWYMPVARPYNPVGQQMGEVMAAQLADVGIEVKLVTEDWATYLDNWDAGKKHGLVQLGWTGDYADPNNFLFTHFGPGNEDEAGYKNQELWDLLGRAGAATSQEESARLFQEAGLIINRDVPRIPIVHAPPVYAAKKALQGWTPSPFGSEPFKDISIQK